MLVGLGALGALVLASCSSSSSAADSGGSGSGKHDSGGGGQAAAADSATVSITPASASPVSPTEPVVVSVAHGTLKTVSVLTPSGKNVTGALATDGKSWKSSEPLGYGKTYKVSADAVGEDGKPVHQDGSVHTLMPQAQAFPSLIPPPSVKDVGVGQPIVVRFDHDITDKAAAERALTVTSNPPQPGGWYWLSKREVHFRPQQYWKAGSTVTLHASVYGVNLGSGVYGQTDRTITFHVHDSWVAKADGRAEQMTIWHNGKFVMRMPISLGSKQYPSHVGPHVISFKAQKYVMDSSTYGVGPGKPGYYRETVYWDERISNDGEFVHAAPWSTGQQGTSNVSHGCVNLSVANATWFFDHFGVGDVVEITNSGGQKLPVYDTYGDWELPWSTWVAGSALH